MICILGWPKLKLAGRQASQYASIVILPKCKHTTLLKLDSYFEFQNYNVVSDLSVIVIPDKTLKIINENRLL